MEMAVGLRLDKVRCAAAHRAADVDPAGTAPRWDAVLVVEVPRPWPRDISAAQPFACLTESVSATIEGADGRLWRPQGVEPEGPPGFARVLAFERSIAAAGPFARREWLVPTVDDELVRGLCLALVGADGEAVSGFEEWRDDPPGDVVDLLVCTHGTRDVCCGSSGVALHCDLLESLGAAGAHDAGGALMRVWRTSHAGGHRFAPTAVSMPDGVSWSHLDVGTAEQILRRQGSPAELGGHWRGAVTVGGAVAQVADREAFVHHGWRWLAAERRSVVVAHDRSSLATTVDALGRLGDGTDLGMRVQVELAGHVAMPACGEVEGPDFATEPVWRVALAEPIPDRC